MASRPGWERGASDPAGRRWPSDLVGSVTDGIRSRFEVDTRALAALRVALGLIILIDLLHRAPYIPVFYTDSGVYPLAAYQGTYDRYTGLSLHAASGALWFQYLLFVVAGVFAVALVLGYRTRLVAFVSLVLLFSLHARNPVVLNGADRLLRVLLLVALLTPLGERWSIDALRRGSTRKTVVGFTTAALLVQPIVVFTQNAYVKSTGTTWNAGTGAHLAVSNDAMAIFLGKHLATYPAVLEVFNWIWVVLLAGSGVFLLATTGRLRAVFALAYIGAFGGMLVTLAVGLFPLVLAASVLPFLTTPVWDRLERLPPSRWLNRWSADRLGLIGPPPVERRLLEALRSTGHEPAVSAFVTGARYSLGVAGALVLVWMLVFSATHAADVDRPSQIDHDLLNEQRWALYAPDPRDSYTWFVVEVDLEDGTTANAFDGGVVNWDRPPDAAAEYDTFRHRKFMERVARSGETGTIAGAYADWACERAAEQHDGRVLGVTVYRLTAPSLDANAEVETVGVVRHPC